MRDIFYRSLLLVISGTAAASAFDLECYDNPVNQTLVWVGHHRPDCDSVASVIGAATLYGGRAAISGPIGAEAEFLLTRCGYAIPAQLADLEVRSVGLVDHNETTQMPPGVKPEQVKAIIDHHGFTANTIRTGTPVAMDIRPWSANSSIVADRFLKSGRPMPPGLAMLLLGGILSDTKALKSKSITPSECEIIRVLAEKAGVEDPAEFGRKMLEVKSELSANTAEEVIHSDYKEYEMNGRKVGIGLAETLDPAPLLKRRNEFAAKLKELKKAGKLDHLLFGVKDITGERVYLIAADNADRDAAKQAYADFLTGSHEGWLILTKTSRKKSLAPVFERAMERVR